jgi:predicted metalloprotease with PDZ domain
MDHAPPDHSPTLIFRLKDPVPMAPLQKVLRPLVVLVLALIGAAHPSQAQSPEVLCTLAMPEPWTHRFEVTITVSRLKGSEPAVRFVMPAWRTGRYVLFNFASGVERFAASAADGKPLAWAKTDKQTWEVRPGGSRSVSVRYTVFANEFRDRTRDLNDEHAFVDETAVFMFADGYQDRPILLDVVPYAGWHVTSGLDRVDGFPNRFRAPNYQVFADCPIEVGTQREFAFEAEGKPHVLMIAGDNNADPARIIEDLKKIIAFNKAFWGELPYSRYVFMLHCAPNAGGATEHLNSAVLHSQPFVFRDPGGYRGFLGLVQHEYFHTWNVKQVRPAAIHPYDFTAEAYAREYWIAEGTTSYYGPLLMLRAGFGSAAGYLDGIAAAIQRDRLRPGNRVQSLSEASFDSWIKFGRRNDDANNAETDLYEKGAQVSRALDLEIRERSANAHSLDDVLREMFRRYRADTRGYTIDDVQRIAESMAGGSLAEFFANYVHGTTPVPWEQFFEYAGVLIVPSGQATGGWIGLATADQGEGATVTGVLAGSPSERAGLSVGDELIALDGYRTRSADLVRRLGTSAVGDTLHLTVFRSDRIKDLRVVVGDVPVPPYRAVKVDRPTALQRSIYESWLGRPWEE